jgi:hypothetical protein
VISWQYRRVWSWRATTSFCLRYPPNYLRNKFIHSFFICMRTVASENIYWIWSFT